MVALIKTRSDDYLGMSPAMYAVNFFVDNILGSYKYPWCLETFPALSLLVDKCGLVGQRVLHPSSKLVSCGTCVAGRLDLATSQASNGVLGELRGSVPLLRMKYPVD
jgi:hypothetical protein